MGMYGFTAVNRFPSAVRPELVAAVKYQFITPFPPGVPFTCTLTRSIVTLEGSHGEREPALAGGSRLQACIQLEAMG